MFFLIVAIECDFVSSKRTDDVRYFHRLAICMSSVDYCLTDNLVEEVLKIDNSEHLTIL